MPKQGIITLLSDFGLIDVYVAVMKGVIAQINSALNIVDITHQVPAQNVAAARFCLLNAYPYFPFGTVHVAVVDPGVGSSRRAIALQVEQGFLVGPDNGLFSGVLNNASVLAAVELTNPVYWHTLTPSTTFHGRDIFASAGAHLASGVAIEKLGNFIEPTSLVQLAIPEKKATTEGFSGCVQYVDHFGNLVTNISAAEVEGKSWWVMVGKKMIPASKTYSEQAWGEVVALIGSHGWVEIAVNGGSAQAQLLLSWGSPVEVVLTTG